LSSVGEEQHGIVLVRGQRQVRILRTISSKLCCVSITWDAPGRRARPPAITQRVLGTRRVVGRVPRPSRSALASAALAALDRAKTDREAFFRLTRRNGRRLDCRNDCSGRALRIRSPYSANEGRLTLVKANASAVMFTRWVSQSEDFRVFTVALGTTRDSTHGDLLLRNCHLPMITAA
jgi:hypothetical protein